MDSDDREAINTILRGCLIFIPLILLLVSEIGIYDAVLTTAFLALVLEFFIWYTVSELTRQNRCHEARMRAMNPNWNPPTK